jgi:hypothetical protein
VWLAYGSYCWTRTCVTTIPPPQRTDIRVVRVRRGAAVRVHLGFVASTATVRIGGRPVRVRRSGRVVSFRIARSGLLQVNTKASGSATFLGRARISE